MEKLSNLVAVLMIVSTTVFVTLKLAGVVHWPWYAVTAPLWFPFAFFLTFTVVTWLVLKPFFGRKDRRRGR